MDLKRYRSYLYCISFSIIILCSLASIASASAPVWSVDFENGYSASSGTLRVINGSTVNPYDTSYPLCLLVDPYDSTNYEAQVGNATVNALLRYENVDSTIIGSTGMVTFDFRITDTNYPQASTILFCPDKAQTSTDWWFIGLSNSHTVLVRSTCSFDSTMNYSGYTDGNVPFTPGWHEMKFTWEQTVAEDSANSIRERADIKLYVDDVLLLDEPNVLWTGSGNRHINIGSYIAKNGTLGLGAGLGRIMLDNFQVYVSEPECGDSGTYYLDADLNQDCYVNFLDVAQFALNWIDDFSGLGTISEEWLQCTHPANPNCDPDPKYITLVGKEEVNIQWGSPLTLNFDAPVGKAKYYLSMDGRCIVNGNPRKGGGAACVKYYVNNKVVYDPDYIVNVPDGRDTAAFNGARGPRTAGANRWYLVINNMDFDPLLSDSQPACLGDWPYRMVLDVTSFVVPGQSNQFKIIHGDSSYPLWTLGFKNVKLIFEYTRPAPDPNFDEIPNLNGQPVLPKTNFVVDYNAQITPGGGILVTAGQDQYVVNSKFSFPNGTLNRLKADGAWEGEWTVDVNANGNQVTAIGTNYKLERTIIRHPERIEVQDKLTNLRPNFIGVRLGHEIIIPITDVKKAYQAGIMVPKKTGNGTLGAANTANPSIYVCKESSGIGLLARDNVFRLHIGLLMKDGSYGIHDRYFALDTGSSYTLKWDIYPTVHADYYDFMNAARRAINGNFVIDGTLVTARGIPYMSEWSLQSLVNANNAKYVILPGLEKLNSTGQETGSMCHGTDFTSPSGYWNRYWMDQFIIKCRNAIPNARLLPYIQPFVTTEANAIEIYPDSNPKRQDGSPQMYMEDAHYAPEMYPSWSNSYGQAFDAFFDWTKDHADGFYLDTSTQCNDLVAGHFNYDFGMWDGHSCLMNVGTGNWDEIGATYQVIQKVTHSGLYTLDYRVSQIRDAKLAGKFVWCNHAAGTDDEAQLQTYRFIETRINNNPCTAHLGCPVGYGNNFWEMVESDLGLSIYMKLAYGGLFQPYGVVYTTGNNILQDMYPITPIELHCGYVLGTEKIITRVTGEYGFGNNSPMSVRFYNTGGFRITGRTASVRYDEVSGSTLANVVLNEGEMAIIFKE